MAMTIPFKEIGKVGKRLLVQIAGITQNYKEVEVVEEIDFKSCPVECAFQQFDAEKKMSFCINQCPFNRQKKTPKVVYMNERHRYHIKTVNRFEDSRLSKYQLLQLLMYHFLGTDSKGFVSFVSKNQLANQLNCSVRTIKNNNKRLEELGLIVCHNYGTDLFNLKINGYEKYHLKKEEGGTGYVQMSQSFVKALIGMDNVNVMRLAIRALLKFDDEVEVRKEAQCEYSYNDIKRFMPTNINHKKIIDELMAKTTHIFDIETTNATVFISLKEEFNGKVQKLQKEVEFTETISTYIQEMNERLSGKEEIHVSNKETENLVELAMEYGVDNVVQAIDICHDYLERDNTPHVIENLGGFIRTIIENSLFRSIEKMVA